jgi:RHS repeat-associated protein
MKSLPTSETLNADKSRARVQLATPKDFASRQLNAQRCGVVILGSFLLALSALEVHAQVGNNNPTGPSGIFNGHAGGCGYDPYTGNATRSITDISVAGAVGEYPLALVRTANSRAPSTTEVFAFAGGWNHNYNWILEESEHSQTQNFHPASYTVEFPDGRVETFKQVNWDTSCYRVRVSNGGAGSSAGVRERFAQLNLNTMFAYLILPDGGKIEFKAVRYTNVNHSRWWYKYHATAIYDPYGLRTQLVSSTTPSGMWRRLDWVIEPAGRSLHFLYTGPNNPKVDHVDASDGRTVQYYYVYCNGCRLDRVRYYNNPAWDARYQYTGSNVGQGLPPLLWTADDPMYAGPMKRIAYEYKPVTPRNPDNTAPVYGQILRERYWDGVVGHEGNGAMVSELTVGFPNNNPVYRTEKRGDLATRTFIYNGAGAGYLAWASDFTDRYASQTYDQTTKYIVAVMDRRGNTTDYTSNTLTGNVTQVQFPAATDVTPSPAPRGTVSYTYGWASCHDPNNRDANNPYFLCTATTEGGQITKFWRDGNKRITKIEYPDGGYEQFIYNGYGQVLTHRLKTGGTETFAYDGLYRLQYYSDAYHNNANNPSIQYFYEGHGWVNGIYDSLAHPTNWTYNNRAQVLVTTLPYDPFDNNTRHTITNAYNPDGTLQSVTNELNFITSYTYDDYRRLKSVTPPGRGDGTGLHTSRFYYGVNAADSANDYKFTDSNVTWVVLPSNKKTKNIYDNNRRKTSVTAGYGSGDDATTSYVFDAVGNLTTITNPLNHNNTTIDYDARNRPSAIHVLSQVTSLMYDTAGRKKKITRPNGQTITYDTFDAMNRVMQQTATQNPTQSAVTRYTYYTTADGATAPVGLLKTMKDPRNTTDPYTYEYDLMGRKLKITYPADTANAHRTEQWSYDDVGRLQTFKNRAGKTQTFTYDGLNRINWLSWDDNGFTPTVHFTYDPASRLVGIDNANATVARAYWNDNSLGAETETPAGETAKTVMCFYDDDGNRGQIYYPDDELTFTYAYTGRNQLSAVGPWATYEYDARGNLTKRTLLNGTHTDYLTYDQYDHAAWVVHYLNGISPGFNYDYDDLSNNRKWVRRLNPGMGDVGDVFKYDLADQTIGFQLNVQTPQNVQSIPQNIIYDANGNRTSFGSDTYTINNNGLNLYSKRNNINAYYDNKASITQSFDGSTYTYDAQNRLTHAAKGSDTIDFAYDGLNRQVKRTVNGTTTYSVWDGWDLIEEYQAGGTPTACYLYGADGLIVDSQVANADFNWYYRDGSGSTSHIADSSGNLKEWYRYDLQGTPFIYAPNNTQRTASAFNVRHLFTAQQWYKEIGLYDLRNRFYSPDIGRFLQPDPIGFRGGNNLYRYCGNNPVTRWDPLGLQVEHPAEKGDADGVVVRGEPIPPPDPSNISRTGFLPGDFGWPGIPTALEPFLPDSLFKSSREVAGAQLHVPESPSVEHPPPSSVPPQNPPQPIDPSHPTTTAEFIAIGNMIEHGNTMDTTPAIDLVDVLSGGIAGLARSSIRSVAADTAATGFRYVSEGEAQIIRKRGQIPIVDRFGNAKNVFYTNESFTSAAEARQALSLPSTPAFRVEFNLGKAPAGYGGIADGGGAEFILREGAAPIPVTLIVPLGE